MTIGKDRHFFPGGNTASGFFSYYHHIYSTDATRVMIIKGGPGVGKSTMMRTIGHSMQSMGHDVEYLHCSSDCNSLDGIRICGLDVALIDGTAPHIVDPRHPGAIEEILHLGDFWNEAAMRTERTPIVAITREVGLTFQRAYKYLAAAKSVYDDIEAVNQAAFNPGVANLIYSTLVQDYLGDKPVNSVPGQVRHLFASAITPLGPVNYLHNLMDGMTQKCIVVGSPGSGRSTLVERFVNAASVRGLAVEAFHCALDPHKYEHAIVPNLGLAIVTSAEPHTYADAGARTVDMDACLDSVYTRLRSASIIDDKQNYQNLFNRAVQFLAEAKSLHDQLEEHYIPHMNFSAINNYRERILERILGYGAEKKANGTTPTDFVVAV